MIRNVLVMKSGLVLFSREFANTVQQPRLLGSLLTAMVEFSKVAAGMQVAYVELTGVAVTLVGNEATNTFCALFHDREDGATFGRLIASEMLNAFLEEHAKDIREKEASSLNLKDFRAFTYRIPGIARKSVQPVLGKLVQVKGILRCALVTETSETFQTAEIDQLGLLANLQALISLSTDIMAQAGNGCVSMSLESSSNSRILIWRIDVWTLVVAVHKSANRNRYQKHIDEAIGVLQKVLELTSTLSNVSAR